MKSLLLFLLRAYKLTISPFLGQHCRFYPSCSAYSDIAIRSHGVVRGSILAGKRLCKCHPWHPGGVDMVPEATIFTEQSRDIFQESGLKLARPIYATPGTVHDAAIDSSIPVSTPPSN
jgi:putative membrane protein insertion efficiency factor